MKAMFLILILGCAVFPAMVHAQAATNAVALTSGGDLYNYDCSYISGSGVNRVYVKLRATDDQDAIQQIKAMHPDAHAILLTRGSKAGS